MARCRRHRAVRRPDAAQARQGLCTRPACRSWAPRRRHRPRRGPQAFQASARQARTEAAAERHRHSVEQSRLVAADLGFPVVVRPSYVLGGRGMAIVHDERSLRRLSPRHLAEPRAGGDQGPLSERQDGADQYASRQKPAADRPLSHRRHRSRCGLHLGWRRRSSSPASWSISRRRACIPAIRPVRCRPYSLDPATIAEIETQTRKLALALKVGGLMNVQYAIQDGDIYVLEVNPRASRTVPFVAKAIGVPVAEIAARVMAGESLTSFALNQRRASNMSGSRKRCCPSRASPAWTRSWVRRCARPAR